MGIIRTLLALGVVLFHSYGIWTHDFVMTGGTVSVQAFYLISGFYMALIINEKYAGKKNSYRLFLSNRFLRIYPVYWATLIFVIMVCLAGQFLFGEPFYLWYWESHWSLLTWTTILALIFSNIFLIGSDWLMFTGISPKTGSLEWTVNPYRYAPMTGQYFFIPQIWTVGLEITFYLIAPFVVRTKWFVQAAMIIASMYLCYYMYSVVGLQHDPWTYRFFPTQLGLFMAGSFAYQVYVFMKRFTIPQVVPAILWSVTVLCIIFYGDIFSLISPGRCWYFYALLFVAIPFVFMFFKDNKWDRFIGELSFPVYVSHHIVMFLWRKFFWTHVHYMKWFGITTAVSSVIFAIGLYYAVIVPLEKIRQRRVQQHAQLI